MTSGTTLTDAAAVLDRARDGRRAADAAEVEQLQAAVEWADLHPVESIYDAALLSRYGDQPLAVAGPGAPLVSEFCVAEFALAVGLPTETGKEYLGEAVELRHRLPRTWARVVSGDLAAWRARRIARETIGLSVAAAGFVDTQVAPYAHRIRPAEVDRLVADAVGRFMPAEAEKQRQQAADGRYLAIEHTQVSFVGTSRIHGELDLADALDLEQAVAREAAVLAACGSDESLDVRRSQAMGQIARQQTSLDLQAADDTDRPAARQTVVHVHLSPDGPFARVEARGRRLVTVEQVREWLHTPLTEVVIRPVVDVTEHLHVDQYEVPTRLADQTAERDLTCVFPWCTRAAESCDDDHVIPFSEGGTTSSDNIAPLCRRHHRLKTHHPGWGYTALEPGSYLWHSPHGYQFLRDHRGTTDVSHDRPPDT